MAHRVTYMSKVVCPHGVTITSGICMERDCALLHANRLEIVRSALQCGVDSVGAAGSSTEASCSTQPVDPPTIVLAGRAVTMCVICLEECEGEPTSQMRGHGENAWGRVRCCSKPMHDACLYKWLAVNRSAMGAKVASCPMCRQHLFAGSRAWSVDVN